MANSAVRSVCPYCGVGCGIVMSVADGKVSKVSGDKQHPGNFGRLCTKGLTAHLPLTAAGRMEDAYVRQQRNQQPARTGIDQAIAETAARLRGILDQHGPLQQKGQLQPALDAFDAVIAEAQAFQGNPALHAVLAKLAAVAGRILG